jgi:lysyl-tRNA synthetase class 2
MSPEFSIKKLLASMRGKTSGVDGKTPEVEERMRGVFEIGPVFRDGEPWGGSHNSEFTMLEWYRLGATYKNLMQDCEALVLHCVSVLGASQRRGMANGKWQMDNYPLFISNYSLSYQGHRVDLTPPWERLTMRQAWQRYAKLDLNEILGARGKTSARGKTPDFEEARRAGKKSGVEERAGVEPAPSARSPTSGVFPSTPDVSRARDALAKVCTQRGYTVSKDDTFDDLFFKIHLTEVEPKLGRERPTFLLDWPSQMAALACRKKIDSRYAERVELYIAGLELADGFSELTDADEQLARFKADQRLRRKLGKPVYPIDQDFITALRHLPKCAGMALGVDRLVMLLTDAATIDEVRWLPATELFSGKTVDPVVKFRVRSRRARRGERSNSV